MEELKEIDRVECILDTYPLPRSQCTYIDGMGFIVKKPTPGDSMEYTVSKISEESVLCELEMHQQSQHDTIPQCGPL